MILMGLPPIARPRRVAENGRPVWTLVGEVDWDEDVQLRLRSSLNLTGTFRCEGGNIFSYGFVAHAPGFVRRRRTG